MYCKKCGKEINNNWQFCKFCGTSVSKHVRKVEDSFSDAGKNESAIEDKDKTEILEKRSEEATVLLKSSSQEINTDDPERTDLKKHFQSEKNDNPERQEKSFNQQQDKQKNKTVFFILAISIMIVSAFIFLLVFKNTPGQRLKQQLSLGDKYLEELNYEDAALAYKAAIEIDPKSADAYVGLTNAYIGLEEYDLAYETVEQGIIEIGIEETLLYLLTKVEEILKTYAAEDKEGIGNESDHSIDISAGESKASERDDYESVDEKNDEYDENLREEEVEDDYEIPPVVAELQERAGKYYIGNDELWTVRSNGKIEEKDAFYEISDVTLSFYDNANTDPDVDFPQTTKGYSPATFRIRKDAKVWTVYSEQSVTAEEYFNRCATFAPEEYRNLQDVSALDSIGELFKVDQDGYIIELSAFPYE